MDANAVIPSPKTDEPIFSQMILRWIELPTAPATVPSGVDLLDITWNERGLRSLRRATRSGRLVRVILPANQTFDHGAVVAETPESIVAINLLPCPALVIRAGGAAELARISFMIGNAHLPAEIGETEIILPATAAAASALGRLKITYTAEIRQVRVSCDGLPMIEISSRFATRSSAPPRDET